MNDLAQRKPRPLFGILSIVLPILMMIVWQVLERNPGFGKGFNGYAGLFAAIALLLGTGVASMVGIAFSITALFRREAFRVLPILGVAINLGFLLWLQSQH